MQQQPQQEMPGFDSGEVPENEVISQPKIRQQEVDRNYLKGGLVHSLHGNIYQLKLLMLFLKRGLDKGYSFRLATEWDAAEKLDDLIFEYIEDNKKIFRFLQGKHKQDASKQISDKDLLTEKDEDFSLQKYFISYRKIKQNSVFKGNNTELKDFVICTNIDLCDDLQNSFETVVDEDNIIDIKVQHNSKPKRLKLKLTHQDDQNYSIRKERLTSIFREATDFNRLAKKLVDSHILRDNDINLKDELFRKYHKALAGSVIDIQTKKLKIDFINDSSHLSKEVKKFRKVLLEKSKLPEVDFKEELQSKNLKISKKFGDVLELEDIPEITSSKSLQSIQDLAKKILGVISEKNINGVITIGLKAHIIKENIAKLAGHVFIEAEDDTIKFRQGFLEGETLPGNLNAFREALKTASTIKGIQFVDLGQYKFNINIQTCTEEDYEEYKKDKSYFQCLYRLPDDEVTIEEIDEFLNKLVLAVNQPNEVELGNIIEDEIGKEFNNVDRKNVYCQFLVYVLDWMKHKKGYFISPKEGKDFFEKIKKEILGAIWFDMKDPVELFTGRKRELSELHKAVNRNQGKNQFTVISQMTSISGLGGIGKSELARKYAYDHGNYYDGNVIWINAEKYETLKESFFKLARDNRLGIPTKDIDGRKKTVESIVKEIYDFFAKRKALFIFDNAEVNFDLKNFLPRSLKPGCNKPYILMTSRDREWGGEIEVVELEEFELNDAVKFVKKGLNIQEDDKSQDGNIECLVKKLQYFPLAIQQAIAYIKDQRVTGEFKIDDYFKEYEKRTKDLLNSEIFTFIDNDYARTTFTTWKITIDKIGNNEQYGKLALEILNTIAYFAPEKISRDIFLNLAHRNETQLKEAVRLLVKYSMVNSEERQSVLTIHRLVQEVIRINLNDKKLEKENVLKQALQLLKDINEHRKSPDIFENVRLSNVDHAASVWGYASKLEVLVRKFSDLPVLIVKELDATLRYQEAYSFGSNALKLLERILGHDHDHVIFMMKNIGSVLYNQGKYRDALEMYLKVEKRPDILHNQIEVTIPGIGKKTYQTLDSHIGLILHRLGKLDEALERFYRDYVLVQENFDSSKFDSCGHAEHNIALVLVDQDKLDDAMTMLQNALKLKVDQLGPDHESTLNTKNFISVVLQQQGKYTDALEISREVYEKRNEILGKKHPDTLTTYGNIAIVLEKLMKYDEALEIANEVDKEREKLYPDHPRTLKGKFLIVVILADQGKYDEALEKCKEVYEKRKRILGANNTDTLDTLDFRYGLALNFAKQRKYEKALEELREVLKEREDILEPNHPDISTTKTVIAQLRQAQVSGEDINYMIMDQTLLFRAAQKGQLEVINELLSKGYNANVQTVDDATSPLHWAAQNGHAGVIKKLLDNGADVNAKDNIKGSTALHIASHRNYLDVVNALLKGGANVDCFDNALFRPLHFAAQPGHIKIVEILLKNDADVEATAIDGLTPLHLAAYHKHLDIVKVLLERGANIYANNVFKMTPFDFTDGHSTKNVILSTKLLPDAIRCEYKQYKIQRLLEYGAVINYFSDTNRLTSLHYAVGNSKGNLDIVSLLLRNKPNVNFADEDGWTPLHYAAQDGHLEIVQLLLDNRADPSLANKDGKIPLQLAQERLCHNSQIYQKIIDILKPKKN